MWERLEEKLRVLKWVEAAEEEEYEAEEPLIERLLNLEGRAKQH